MNGRIICPERNLLVTPLPVLLDLVDPLGGDPWGVGQILPADVYDHASGRREAHAGQPCREPGPGAFCRGCEIVRIAHLAEHGWPPVAEDRYPITVNVGLWGYLPDWPLIDGNHRVAAAYVAGETHVALRADGDWDRAVALLVHGLPVDQALAKAG